MTPEEKKLPRRCWLCGNMLQLKKGGGFHRATKVIDEHLRHLHIGCKEQHDANPDYPTHVFPAIRVDADR